MSRLDEKRHASYMLQTLNQMKIKGEVCDFTIKTGNDEFGAHRNVLTAGSPYFKAMLSHNTKECQDGCVEFRDVDPACVKVCIDFIYTGKYNVPNGKFGELLHIAIMLQLENLKEKICLDLRSSINVENIYTIIAIADCFRLENVTTSCKSYYEENFMTITVQPEFLTQTKSHVLDMLKGVQLQLNEQEKLILSLKWVGQNSERKVYLIEFLKLIRLREVSVDFLKNVVKSYSAISSDFHAYKLITSTIIEKMEERCRALENGCCKNSLLLFDLERDCLRSYDPISDQLMEFNDDTLEDIRGFSAVYIDDTVYVLCWEKSTWRLDLKDKKPCWRALADTNFAHGGYPPLVSLCGSLFVVGGGDHVITNAVEEYFPRSTKWRRRNDLPEAIGSLTVVGLDSSVYCIGGRHSNNVLKSFSKYIPSSGEYTELAPMNKSRIGCAAVVVRQRILVMGGSRGVSDLSGTECYDLLSGQWSTLSPMIGRHGKCLAHLIGGYVFVVAYGEIERYDPGNDCWSNVPRTERRFKNHGSVLVQL